MIARLGDFVADRLELQRRLFTEALKAFRNEPDLRPQVLAEDVGAAAALLNVRSELLPHGADLFPHGADLGPQTFAERIQQTSSEGVESPRDFLGRFTIHVFLANLARALCYLLLRRRGKRVEITTSPAASGAIHHTGDFIARRKIAV